MDLRERYGRSYKVGYEEATTPSMALAPGRRSLVPDHPVPSRPHSRTAHKTGGRDQQTRPNRPEAGRYPGVTLWQDGDDGKSRAVRRGNFVPGRGDYRAEKTAKAVYRKAVSGIRGSRVLFVPKSVAKEAVNAAVRDGSPKASDIRTDRARPTYDEQPIHGHRLGQDDQEETVKRDPEIAVAMIITRGAEPVAGSTPHPPAKVHSCHGNPDAETT